MANRQFDIMSDSSCDMTENYYTEHNVEIVKLGFMMNDVDFLGESGEHISDDDFYRRLAAGAMPTTYQVTSEVAKLHMEKYMENGRDLLVVAFSSGLSGTCGSFQIAAKEMMEKYPERKVVVVDSLCASMGEGLFLDYVCKKADEGVSLEETAEYAENLKLHICHDFTVNDLYHLHRGGRLSKTTALVGTILKIKPVLHMDDLGHLVAVGKKIGRKSSLSALVENMKKGQCFEKGEPIFISYGFCPEDAESVKNLIEKDFPENPVICGSIGPVIGAHSGIGTVALFYRGNKR